MNSKIFIKAGKIIKSQGIHGELIVKLEGPVDVELETMYIDLMENNENVESVHIAYDIEKLERLDTDTVLVKFREISDRSQTNFLSDKSIFVKRESYGNLITTKHTQNYDICGYDLYNQNNKYIGKISGIQNINKKIVKASLMMVTNGNQKIPVRLGKNGSIMKVDNNKKKVFAKIPEEFLEMFLVGSK